MLVKLSQLDHIDHANTNTKSGDNLSTRYLIRGDKYVLWFFFAMGHNI